VCRTQDKLLRTLILDCLSLTVRTYLRQQPADGRGGRSRSDAWLARTTKPIMVNVRKGNFQFSEQQVGSISFRMHALTFMCSRMCLKCMFGEKEHTLILANVNCSRTALLQQCCDSLFLQHCDF
jgi:hypothetical protein